MIGRLVLHLHLRRLRNEPQGALRPCNCPARQRPFQRLEHTPRHDSAPQLHETTTHKHAMSGGRSCESPRTTIRMPRRQLDYRLRIWHGNATWKPSDRYLPEFVLWTFTQRYKYVGAWSCARISAAFPLAAQYGHQGPATYGVCH
jgi:hypothetical protein